MGEQDVCGNYRRTRHAGVRYFLTYSNLWAKRAIDLSWTFQRAAMLPACKNLVPLRFISLSSLPCVVCQPSAHPTSLTRLGPSSLFFFSIQALLFLVIEIHIRATLIQYYLSLAGHHTTHKYFRTYLQKIKYY